MKNVNKINKFLLLLFLCFSPRAYTKFQQIPGILTSIDIGRGGEFPIIAGIKDGIPVQLQPDWKTWKPLPLKQKQIMLKQISIASNGKSIWAIDKKNGVWRFMNKAWEKIPGLFKQISVGNEHEVWGMDTANKFHRKTDPSGPQSIKHKWQYSNGAGIHIAASGDGTILISGKDQKLSRFNRFQKKWFELYKPTISPPLKIELKDRFNIIYLGYNKKIWKLTSGTFGNDKTHWKLIEGKLKFEHVAIGIDGTIVALNKQGNVYVKHPTKREQVALLAARGQVIQGHKVVKIVSGLNWANKRVWTIASSHYDLKALANPPNNHLGLLVGTRNEKKDRRQDVGSFFSLIKSKKPTSKKAIKYGDVIEIFSLYAVRGHPKKAGPLGKAWKWWAHKKHFKWGKNWADLIVSLKTNPNTKNGNQLFKISSPTGQTGLIHSFDTVEFISLAPDSYQKKMFTVDWSRFGKGFHELLIPAKEHYDHWGNQHDYFGARDRGGSQHFHIQRITSDKQIPDTAGSPYTTVTALQVYYHLTGKEWYQAQKMAELKKAQLRGETKEGIGIVQSIKNDTIFPLVVKRFGTAKPKGSLVLPNINLFDTLKLSGHSISQQLRRLDKGTVLSLTKMMSKGAAWINKPLDIQNKATITFLARAGDPGGIQAVFDAVQNVNPTWRVVIGGWNNTKSAILYGKRILAKAEGKYSPLAKVEPGRFVPYWITIHEGFIMVGQGAPGKNVFLAGYVPQATPIKYIGFSTGNGPVDYAEIQVAETLVPLAEKYIYNQDKSQFTIPASKTKKPVLIKMLMRVLNEITFAFNVTAKKDVELIFQNKKQENYKVIFGGEANSEIIIAKNDVGVSSFSIDELDFAKLDPEKSKRYWVSLNGNLLLVGYGKIGNNILMAWQDKGYINDISQIGFIPADDHSQSISNLVLAPPVSLGTEKAQLIHRRRLRRIKFVAAISIFNPIEYHLIQTGQYVTLKDMITGNIFPVVKTSKKQGKFPFMITIGPTGIPSVRLTEKAKNAGMKVQLKKEAARLEKIGGAVQMVTGLAAGAVAMKYGGTGEKLQEKAERTLGKAKEEQEYAKQKIIGRKTKEATKKLEEYEKRKKELTEQGKFEELKELEKKEKELKKDIKKKTKEAEKEVDKEEKEALKKVSGKEAQEAHKKLEPFRKKKKLKAEIQELEQKKKLDKKGRKKLEKKRKKLEEAEKAIKKSGLTKKDRIKLEKKALRQRRITRKEWKKGAKQSAKAVGARAASAGIASVGTIVGAYLHAQAELKKIEAKFYSLGDNRYVVIKAASHEPLAQQFIPQEALRNTRMIKRYLAEIDKYSIPKEARHYVRQKRDEEFRKEMKRKSYFPKLMNLYKEIINRVNHYATVQNKKLKNKIFAGLQEIARFHPSELELFEDLMNLFANAYLNPYITNPKEIIDRGVKKYWYNKLTKLAFILFKNALKDPASEVKIPPLFGDYVWLPQVSVKKDSCWLTFNARGQNDLLICFAPFISNQRNQDHKIYEVAIGAWDNTKTGFRVNNLGREVKYVTRKQKRKAMLREVRDQSYWISFNNGLIKMGIGKNINKKTILKWQDPYPNNWKGKQQLGFGSWNAPITVSNIKTSLVAS